MTQSSNFVSTGKNVGNSSSRKNWRKIMTPPSPSLSWPSSALTTTKKVFTSLIEFYKSALCWSAGNQSLSWRASKYMCRKYLIFILSSLISEGWDQDIKITTPQFKTGEWCVEVFQFDSFQVWRSTKMHEDVYDLDKYSTEQTFRNKHEVHAGILF